MKTLVVGFGNALRSDDGVGPHVAQKLEQLHLPNTDTQVYQQLNIELIDELVGYDRVILVDASEEGPEIRLMEVDPALAHENISSHYFRPELLLAMMQKIYQRGPHLTVCSIRGENFELGMTFSPAMRERAQRAVQAIVTLIKK